MTLKVQVTADDIEHGQKAATGGCPLARALRRTTGLVAFVSYGKATFKPAAMQFDYCSADMPVEALNFVRAFDNNRGVAPAEFVFQVPDWVYKAYETNNPSNRK